MAHGGARPGAGRKKDGANKLAAEAIAKAEAGGEMPLDYLLRVMRDPLIEDSRRIDAAKAAAPYCHARRAPVGSDGEDASGVTVIVSKP